MDSPALTPGQFSAVVTAITSAFGDPTRREIYLFAHEHERGVTAAHVAERFELHPNVARHHLDKLAAGGYLDVVVERGEHGGAGRPSKHYRASTTEVSLDVPVGTDDVVLTLLGRALALLPPDQAQEMAEEVGIEYGRDRAPGDLRGRPRHGEGDARDPLRGHQPRARVVSPSRRRRLRHCLLSAS